MQQRRHLEAIRVFDDLLRRHPDHSLAYNDLAVLYCALGMPARAHDAVERALALDPESAPARANLATLAGVLPREERAVRAPFRAPRLRIDFIAYHDIHAQAAASVFEALAEHHDCQWRIGPNQRPTGAEVAVMLDHHYFQPHLKKAPDGYRHIVHMTHDVADLMLYFKEKDFIRECDLVLTPAVLHEEVARRALGSNVRVQAVGWPKFDRLAIPPEHALVEARLRALPKRLTILYAPTIAWTFEWMDLLPRLREMPVNLVVKNHIYVNPGQALPEGAEAKYRAGLASADAMEAYVETTGLAHWIVAPRTLNSCSVFPFCQVALSDTSSLLAEFLPFGLAIETGRIDLAGTQEPEISTIWPEVTCLPPDELQRLLATPSELERRYASRTASPHALVAEPGAGERAARAIDDYLFEAVSMPRCA